MASRKRIILPASAGDIAGAERKTLSLRRRSAFEAVANATFLEDFSNRILSFGSDAASEYAHIAVQRRRDGRPISSFDAQIAAITRPIALYKNALSVPSCRRLFALFVWHRV